MNRWVLHSDQVEVGVTEQAGHLDPVRFPTPRGVLAPLSVAPWADEKLAEDVPPILRVLRGDFFCAPFGANDLAPDETRVHGATANDHWQRTGATTTTLDLTLTRPVLGARVHKHLAVRPGQPIVYQRHEFVGGAGRLPLGHHAMVKAPETCLLGLAPWVRGVTPPTRFESDPATGHSLLAYPQEFDSLARLRLADGGMADVSRYPAFDRPYEDLVMVTFDPALPLAWASVTAPQAGWVWFDLRRPRHFASTVLWMSNGGRDYAPWNGRHRRVLGVEALTSYCHLGHRASVEPNPLSERGLATSVELDPAGTLALPYLFGCVPVPAGYGRVREIKAEGAGVTLVDDRNQRVAVACDLGFLET